MMLHASAGEEIESLATLRTYFFVDCPSPDLTAMAARQIEVDGALIDNLLRRRGPARQRLSRPLQRLQPSRWHLFSNVQILG